MLDFVFDFFIFLLFLPIMEVRRQSSYSAGSDSPWQPVLVTTKPVGFRLFCGLFCASRRFYWSKFGFFFRRRLRRFWCRMVGFSARNVFTRKRLGYAAWSWRNAKVAVYRIRRPPGCRDVVAQR